MDKETMIAIMAATIYASKLARGGTRGTLMDEAIVEANQLWVKVYKSENET